MKSVKKILFLLLAFILPALYFSACTESGTKPDDGRLHVVCTTFPAYDWVRQITDDEVTDVSLLVASGADLHSYQPTAADIARIADSDLVICVGGESDAWALEAAKNAGSDTLPVSLLALLGEKAKTEQMAMGMEHESEHEHEPGTAAADEHVWLSLKNAAFLTEKLALLLGEAEPERADAIMQAADAYRADLEDLDEGYHNTVNAAPHKEFVVADRFPFRYLADDYGLTYYAAFPGCSAETDAGFDTVIFLSGQVDEHGLSHIAVTESTDGNVARAVIENAKVSGVSVVTLDSMQSVSQDDIEAGTTYLAVMEKNLKALEQLLS